MARGIEDFVQRRRQRRRRGVMAVAGAMVLFAAGMTWRQNGRWSDDSAGSLAEIAPKSVVSAPARQTLPDGSRVELKGGAEIAVEFAAGDAGARSVVLKRGEAHFTVAKDPQRPFIVMAGGVEVRAIGTAFAVERGARQVEVLVTEGRVAVAQPDAKTEAAEPLARVGAGNRAVVSLDAAEKENRARVEAVTPAQLHQRLAWRVPRLEFNGTPLGEVVALFNEHAAPQPNGVVPRLVLADAELKVLPLSGTLRADNLSVLLRILETSYGIAVEMRDDGEVVVRKGR